MFSSEAVRLIFKFIFLLIMVFTTPKVINIVIHGGDDLSLIVVWSLSTTMFITIACGG